MPDNYYTNDANCFKEEVCIHANRIYDSCSDKSCLTDLQLHFTDLSIPIITEATSIRCRSASVMLAVMNVDAVPFNTGFYSVDLTYYFLVTLDAYTGTSMIPQQVEGIAYFNKKVILYGSEGKTRLFCSDQEQPASRGSEITPRACVQVANPIVLSCRLVDTAEAGSEPYINIPQSIRDQFEGSFDTDPGSKTVLVSLGVFSILHLQRNVQVMVPAMEFCVPDKECLFTTDDPCEIFRKIKFPTGEFFPPKLSDLPEE